MEESPLPPNARIDSLVFDDGEKSLMVTLRGEPSARRVPAGSVAALHGARIRHGSLTTAPGGVGEISATKIAITVTTGIPVGTQKSRSKETVTVGEDLHFAIAIRTDGVGALWYLLAASFNFRKALGPDATYSTELNLRAFIKRLADFAPQAVQDSFFTAMRAGSPLPPPLDGLIEFFKYAKGA